MPRKVEQRRQHVDVRYPIVRHAGQPIRRSPQLADYGSGAVAVAAVVCGDGDGFDERFLRQDGIQRDGQRLLSYPAAAQRLNGRGVVLQAFAGELHGSVHSTQRFLVAGVGLEDSPPSVDSARVAGRSELGRPVVSASTSKSSQVRSVLDGASSARAARSPGRLAMSRSPRTFAVVGPAANSGATQPKLGASTPTSTALTVQVT